MSDHIERTLDEIETTVREHCGHGFQNDDRETVRGALLRLIATAVSSEKTLAQAHAEVMIAIHTKPGIVCPACTKLAKVYRRSISASVVSYLQKMIQTHALTGEEWLYITGKKKEAGVPGYIKAPAGGDYAKLRWWNLIEQMDMKRDDGSPRNGRWKVTAEGLRFARGEIRVPRYIWEYNNKPIEEQPDSKLVFIHEIKGVEFDFQSILQPPPPPPSRYTDA